MLEPNFILDDPRIAYETVVSLMQSYPDLTAIYDCGGGREGLVSALREERGEKRLTVVCNELTTETKSALVDGVLDLVLDTPTSALATRLVHMMIAACESNRVLPEQVLLPATLFISENL